MMFNKINTCNSQFSIVTKNYQISMRKYLKLHLKHLHVQVHVSTAKQEKLCELVRVVLTCILHVQVPVPVSLLNLSNDVKNHPFLKENTKMSYSQSQRQTDSA